MNLKINRFIEILRWIGVAIGIFFAFYWGTNTQSQFSIYAIFTIISIAGFTALEVFFFGKEGSIISGYQDSGAYQRQSGIHFLALSITIILALLLNWGFYAYTAVYMVLLIFLTISAVNHLITGLKEKLVINTLLRPILTFLLWIITLILLLPAI